MSSARSPKSLDSLTPEHRAKVEVMMGRRHTPEAREDEVRDREALAEEYRRSGSIAPAGPPVEVETLVRFRRFVADLRGYREKAGISLATVSERSGIDQPALSRLENGRSNPTMGTLSRYLQALGVVPKITYEVPAH